MAADTSTHQSATFGRRVQRRRIDAGLKLVTVSRAAGISPTLLSAIERGARPPPSPAIVTRLLRSVGFESLEIAELRELAARERASAVADEQLPEGVLQVIRDLRLWGPHLDPRLLKALRGVLREAVRETELSPDDDPPGEVHGKEETMKSK